MPARDLRHGPRFADGAFRWSTLLAGGLILAILALIVVTMTSRAWPALRHQGPSFFTERRWAPNADVYGALSFIYGTLVTSTIAVVIAVPLSVGIALFTTQVAPPWLRRPLVSLTDLVAVVPSVVFGLWGILVLAPRLQRWFTTVHGWFGDWPVLGADLRARRRRSHIHHRRADPRGDDRADRDVRVTGGHRDHAAG